VIVLPTPLFSIAMGTLSGEDPSVGTRTRTRPDDSGRPSYITVEGYRHLEELAHNLWTEERPKMAKAVQVAAAEGDRSENAEYQYSKRKLAEIDRRLRYLGKRLEVLEVVTESPPDDGRVYFSSWVTLEDQSGSTVTYRIVGPDETNAEAGWISVESPLAKALLGREEGDEVEVRRPKGNMTYEILRVGNTPAESETT
jgi:transcription elongation factor GreB